MDCIFCKIIKGEIPTMKLYEDEKTLAFLDVNPCSIGHSLIIPKKHYQRFEEMPEEAAKDLFYIVHKLAKIIPEAVEAKDYNVGLNNGKIAGQEVPHVHFHIIPRFEGDKGLPLQGIVRMEIKKEDLPKIAEKIKTHLNCAEPSVKEDIKETKEVSKADEEKESNKTEKSFGREMQEFDMNYQDKAPNYSEVRKEEY